MEAETIIETARKVVSGHSTDRDKGSERTFRDIARVFNALTGHNLTEKDADIFMVVVKLVRAYRNNDPDNYVDAIGYMGMAGEAATGKDSDVTENP